MGLLIILLLILAAALGVLGLIVKVALGVALGIFLGFVLVAWLVAWRVARALWGSRPGWRRVRGSTVEVLARLAEREADQGQPVDPRIPHGRSKRQVGAERPPADEQGSLGLASSQPHRGCDVRHRLFAAGVFALGPHYPPEVERQDGEP